jgi:hypothetical protein
MKKHVTKDGTVKIKWEDWELEVLRTNYEKWGPDYCLNYLPDRNRVQVIGKANRLGLMRENNKRFKGNRSALNHKTCAVGMSSIECKRCRELLEVNSINFMFRGDRQQYSTVCRPCMVIRQRELRDSSISKHLGSLISNATGRKGGNATPSDMYKLWEKQGGRCAITGVEMTFGSDAFKTDRYTTISIDRIDCYRLYDIDNIQLVCLWVNIAKYTLPMEAFKEWCKLVVNPIQMVTSP